MKHVLSVHEFSFNKIKKGTRRVGVHLLDKQMQKVKLHDVIEMHNVSDGDVLECEVVGIAIFDNMEDLVDAIGPHALGYDNKEEIMVRVNRLFSKEMQDTFNAVGFYFRLFLGRGLCLVRSMKGSV